MLYQGKGEKSTAEKSYSIYIRMISLKDIMLWFSLQIRCRSGICPFFKKKNSLHIYLQSASLPTHSLCRKESFDWITPQQLLVKFVCLLWPLLSGKVFGHKSL